MKDFMLKHKWGLLLIIPGIIAGYLYWKYVGCTSGTCPITSNWHSMILFGGLIGYFIGDIVDDYMKRKSFKKNEV